MQISRMPIPADDCANCEMSVDTNPSDTKSDLETETKVNGDSHKKLNGAVEDDCDKTDKASEVVDEEVKEEKIEIKKEKDEQEEKEPEVPTEPVLKSTDEHVENGTSEELEPKVNIENPVADVKLETDVDDEVKDDKSKDEEVKPMEIDETNDKLNGDVDVKKVKEEPNLPSPPEVPEDMETEETEKKNGKSNGVLKNGDGDTTNLVNGDVKLSDDEKITKSQKVSPKVPEEEDLSSEISTDTLSPKQVPMIF